MPSLCPLACLLFWVLVPPKAQSHKRWDFTAGRAAWFQWTSVVNGWIYSHWRSNSVQVFCFELNFALTLSVWFHTYWLFFLSAVCLCSPLCSCVPPLWGSTSRKCGGEWETVLICAGKIENNEPSGTTAWKCRNNKKDIFSCFDISEMQICFSLY